MATIIRKKSNVRQ